MILSAIVAMAENRVIGRDGRLPWNIPEDLKYFREKTLNKPVIMGRKTFDSIGRPLPRRENIVLTRRPNWQAEGVRVFSSLDDAIRDLEAKSTSEQEVFIIGGSEIYAQALSRIQRLYITMIEASYEGDARFPEVDLRNDFKIVSETPHSGSPSFRFIVAERISK